jgi:hypothetical protein
LFYSGSGITVIAPDQIRPPVPAHELVQPPRYGLKLAAIWPGSPGYDEILAQAEALSAIARSNAERGVDEGGGVWGALEQIGAFFVGFEEGLNDGRILILDNLTCGWVPGLNTMAAQVRTANAGSMAYTVADWSATVGTTLMPGAGALKMLGIGSKTVKAAGGAAKAAAASTAAIKASRAAQGAKTIGATGKIGEQALKKLGGKSQQSFRTSKGLRYVDQLVDGVAHESKVGYTTLNKKIQTQIQKDAELIRNKEIKGAVWHFFVSPKTGAGGPSAPLLEALRGNGIGVVIH